MKQKKIIAAVLTLLVILILPLAASAANTYRFKGKNAYADFSSFDGCTYTYAAVSGNEQVTNSVRETRVFAYVSKYNECTGEFSDASGESVLSNPKDFTLKGQLKSARLATTVTVFDFWTGAPTDLQINLTWTGTGDISKGQVKQKSNTGACKFQYSSKGSFRAANVSGTISDGATDYVSGATGFAQLGESKESQMTVNCD